MTTFGAFRRLGLLALLAGVFVFLPSISAQPDVPPYNPNEKTGPPPPVPKDEDAPEVQGRGPIHEGFAQPNNTPQPGPVAPKGPPEPIPEQPPEERPEGDNVVWVPGYWAFDEDKDDFLWVSGFWRVAPAGRKWVPGYWTKTDAGWQWVSGFWAPERQEEVPYVPEVPPDSLDRGPSIPPPSDDYYYVAGSWSYQDRYVWSPGYWCRPRLGFVWCPPRWCWTPRGYLYVSGFWDRDFGGRGVLFAPVYFPRPLWHKRGWFFRPAYVVPPRVLVGSLWVRPRGGYYAYGDYYAARYSRAGYQPWVTYGPKVRDPLYNYYNWANRDNRNWQRNLVSSYQDRSKGDAPVPPRTLAAQQRLQARDRNVSADLVVAQPLERYKSDNVRLAKVSQSERATQERFAESVRKSSVERKTAEARTLRRDERPAPLSLNKVAVPPPQATRTPQINQTAPKVQTPQPKQQPPEPKQRQQEAPKNQPAPRVQTPPPQPKPAPPPQRQEAPKSQPAPKVQTPPPQPKQTPVPQRQQEAPKAQPAPRVQTPPPQPKPAPPQQRQEAPKAQPAPRVQTPPPQPKPAPQPQSQQAPPKITQPAPRVQTPPPAPQPKQQPAPRVQQVTPPPQAPAAQPRPQAPPPRVNVAPRSNPAPQPKSSPPPRSAPTQGPKKR